MHVRRIEESEAAAVTELWDRMCQEDPDGGPLTERGKRNIERMLQIAAWHRDTVCLVAIDQDEVVGFVVAELTAGDGLLPGLSGEIHELYAVPPASAEELARAAVDRMRKCGAGTIRKLVDATRSDLVRFWQQEGFDADMICLSSYRP